MSVNKYLPHVFVLPEDDANRQLANGFDLDIQTRQFRVLPEAGGWLRVRDNFISNHVVDMMSNPKRHMVLLVDFDEDADRARNLTAEVPELLHDRVFVLGSYNEPEDLRRAGLGSYEEIGRAMATDCRRGTRTIWAHPHLRHNDGELVRLSSVCRFLFSV